MRKSHVDESDIPVIVFVDTTTADKVYQYNQAAKRNGHNIKFFQIHSVYPHAHSPDEEEASFEGNANAKMAEARNIARHLQKNEFIHVKNFFAENGLPAESLQKTYISVDDAGFSIVPYRGKKPKKLEEADIDLAKNLWKAFDKDGIPEYITDRIDLNLNTDEAATFPGTETAPLLSALMGEANFMNRLRAALKLLNKGKKTEQKVHLAYQERVYFEMEPLLKQEKNGAVIETRVAIPCSTTLLDLRPVITAARNRIWDHIFSGNESVTSRPALTLLNRARTEIEKEIAANVLNLKSHRPVARNIDDLNVAWFGDANGYASKLRKNPPNGFSYKLTNDNSGIISFTERNPYNTLSEPEVIMRSSDAIIFTPYDLTGKSPEEREKLIIRNLFMLSSLLVAKQTDARDMTKPIIILNHNNCWSEILELVDYFIKHGTCKDFSIPPAPLQTFARQGITVTANSYYHVLSGDDSHKLYLAAKQLSRKAREGYFKAQPAEASEFETDGKEVPNDKFAVTIFTSASCENSKVNNNLEDFTLSLFKDDIAVRYGGGDRYAMGAIYRASQSATNIGLTPLLSAISTQTLVRTETKHGVLPDDIWHRKLVKNIPKRLVDLLKSNVLVSYNGGIGTWQEVLAFVRLKQLHPDFMKDKELILCNDKILKEDKEGYYTKIFQYILQAIEPENSEVIASLNSNQIEELFAQRFGVIITSNLDETKSRIEKSKQNWVKRISATSHNNNEKSYLSTA